MHLGKCWRGHALYRHFCWCISISDSPSHPTTAMIKCHDRSGCWYTWMLIYRLAQQRVHVLRVLRNASLATPHFARGVASAIRTCQILGVGSKLIKFENVYSRTRSSEEGVRPTFQASPDRRLWRREDVRTLQIRGRHFQHDLHINHRWVSFCQPDISLVTHIRAILRFAIGDYNLCPKNVTVTLWLRW